MIIKPSVKMNLHLTTHPLGIKKLIQEQIDYVKAQPKIENGPKNALVLGGAAGYGLATRIALTWGANSNTISVSRGGKPKGRRTGSAGYWAAKYFDKLAVSEGFKAKSIFGDVFSHETRAKVAKFIKDNYGKLDLLVYSIAAGVRINPDTKEKVISSLKPIEKEINTFTIDVATLSKKDLKIQPATQKEIDNTIYCMGGQDWKLWVDFLKQQNLLSENFKTVTYTYIGSDITNEIYRTGTIGEAKKHLEKTAKELNEVLSNKINGKAYVSASKAIVSKASVFIPSMVVYGSALFEASLKHNMHESVIAHKYRMLKDFIYNDDFNDTIIRLDSYELNDKIQKEVLKYMDLFKKDEKGFFQLEGAKLFVNNFYKINGFGFDNIDYEKNIDLDTLP